MIRTEANCALGYLNMRSKRRFTFVLVPGPLIPGSTRYPVDEARRRRTLFDWTPDQVRGDGSWDNDKSEACF